MKFLFVFIVAIVSVASAAFTPLIGAPTLIRTPQYDSAVIQSDRHGANFAYSTVEGHAYQAISPVIGTAIHPVQVRYDLHAAPVAIAAPHHYIIQNPILSSFAPALEVSGGGSKAENGGSEGTKVDEDSISVESA